MGKRKRSNEYLLTAKTSWECSDSFASNLLKYDLIRHIKTEPLTMVKEEETEEYPEERYSLKKGKDEYKENVDQQRNNAVDGGKCEEWRKDWRKVSREVERDDHESEGDDNDEPRENGSVKVCAGRQHGIPQDERPPVTARNDEMYVCHVYLSTMELTNPLRHIFVADRSRVRKCLQKFPSLEALERHKLDEHREKLHKCPSCPRSFCSVRALSKHVKAIHSDKNRRLSLQQQEQQQEQHKQQQQQQQKKQQQVSKKFDGMGFACNVASRIPSSFQSQHLNKSDCKSDFHIRTKRPSSYDSIKDNVKMDHGNGEHDASICSVSFKAVENVGHHLREDLSDSQKFCHMCSKLFPSKESLKCHLKEMHESGQYFCFVCAKTFSSEYKLKLHMQNIHEQPSSYYCEMCDKEFKNYPSMKRHEKSVHDVKQHPCNICRNIYSSKWALRRHMMNIHDWREHEEPKTNPSVGNVSEVYEIEYLKLPSLCNFVNDFQMT